MPTLDVSEVLLSPEFMDTVTVYRRVQVVNEYGETSTVNTPYIVNAVITTAAPDDLNRMEDEQNMPRCFTIISTFRLQGPTPTTQPDLVLYLGAMHIIDRVEPYTRYGAGLVEAHMSSVDHADPPL